MSDTVIRVENLSKKYLLRHQQRERYVALRDVIANKIKAFGSKLIGRNHELSASKFEEEFYALKDIAFEVKRGERIGIIGRNGAGKSTLLKILSRITEPTTGRIEIKGRVASLLEVGTGFHPELTGRENIFLNGAILGMTRSEIKRKFDEIVDFAEIEKFLDTPVKHFSSGMYVRLAFAVAAHMENEILLVDEVLAVGDAEFQKKCMGKMSEMSDTGRTVFFVSHNMGAISAICRSGMLLVKGRARYFEDMDDCVSEYLHQAIDTGKEVIPLREIKRSDFALRGGALFISAQMLNEKESLHWKIPFPTSPTFLFSFEIRKHVPNLEMGIALFNQARIEIVTSLSSDSIAITQIGIGTYEITTAYEELVLVPGLYSLSVGLRSDLGFEDYLPEVLSFEVLASKESGDAKAHMRRGAIIPKVRYVIRGDDGCELESAEKH